MSAKKKAKPATSPSTAVMVKPWDAAEGAVMVFAGIDKITELATLAAESSHITEITNAAGREQVHAFRMGLKNRRLDITEAGLDARRKALGFNKKVTAQEGDYIKLIEPEETRLQKLQDDYDAKLEQQKQSLIDAEIARQAALQERVAELHGNQALSPTSGSALIAEHISDLEAIPVDESFDECREQAEAAKSDGLTRLRVLHAAAVAHEAEQKRIADERVELARLRKEAAERAAADAERERQAKVARDAEAARHAEQLRQQTEDAAREQAARQKIIDDHNARIAADHKAAQEKLDAEAKRQADAAADLARQQEELRKAQEPAPVFPAESPEPKAVVFGEGKVYGSGGVFLGTTAPIQIVIYDAPSRDEIIDIIAVSCKVDGPTALSWLARIDWCAALAEAA